MANSNNNERELLELNLNELKSAYNSPRIHLANFFDNLRHKIDMEFYLYARQENSQSSHILQCNLSQIIDEVKSFEHNCFKELLTNQFDEELSNKVSNVISKCENELAKNKSSKLQGHFSKLDDFKIQ